MSEKPLPPRIRGEDVQALLESLDLLGPTSNALLDCVASAASGIAPDKLRERRKDLAKRGVLCHGSVDAIGVGVTQKSRTAVLPGPRFAEARELLGRGVLPQLSLQSGEAGLMYVATLWLLEWVANGAELAELSVQQLRDEDESHVPAVGLPGLPTTTKVLRARHPEPLRYGLVATRCPLGPRGCDVESLIAATPKTAPVDLFVGPVNRAQEVALNRLLVGHHGLANAGRIVVRGVAGDAMQRAERAQLTRIATLSSSPELLLAALQIIAAYRLGPSVSSPWTQHGGGRICWPCAPSTERDSSDERFPSVATAHIPRCSPNSETPPSPSSESTTEC